MARLTFLLNDSLSDLDAFKHITLSLNRRHLGLPIPLACNHHGHHRNFPFRSS